MKAEAYLAKPSYIQAQQAVDAFFLHDPPQNQFFCRALCVQAHLIAQQASQKKGAEYVQKILQAIDYILRALRISQQNGASYYFMVYNVSVHYYNITRLMVLFPVNLLRLCLF